MIRLPPYEFSADARLRLALRANTILLTLVLLLLAVDIVCNISASVYAPWNDARLAPVAAWLRGFPFYAAKDHGVILGNYYSPLGGLFYFPAGLINHPVPAIMVASTMALTMNLSAGVAGLFIWSRGQSGRFATVLLGSAVYLALLYVTDATNFILFAVHVDSPAIALMLWGVIFFGRWWVSRRPWMLAVSAVLFSTVVWTKQLGLPLPLAFGAATLFICGPRSAFAFALWSLATSVFWALALMPVIGDWHAFFFSALQLPGSHPWKLQVTGSAFDRLRLFLWASTVFLRQYWLLFILPLAMAFGLNAAAKTNNNRSPRLAFALVASALIAAITMLPLALLGWVKEGGDANAYAYSVQPLLFAFVIGGIALLGLAKDADGDWRLAGETVVVACLIAFFGLLRPGMDTLRYPFKIWQSPEVTAYNESKSGHYWFPEFPLGTLLATGRAYHHSYSVFALYLGGWTVSPQQFSEGIPTAPFTLKYLFENPGGTNSYALVGYMKIAPADLTEQRVGPWQEVQIRKFPPD